MYFVALLNVLFKIAWTINLVVVTSSLIEKLGKEGYTFGKFRVTTDSAWGDQAPADLKEAELRGHLGDKSPYRGSRGHDVPQDSLSPVQKKLWIEKRLALRPPGSASKDTIVIYTRGKADEFVKGVPVFEGVDQFTPTDRSISSIISISPVWAYGTVKVKANRVVTVPAVTRKLFGIVGKRVVVRSEKAKFIEDTKGEYLVDKPVVYTVPFSNIHPGHKDEETFYVRRSLPMRQQSTGRDAFHTEEMWLPGELVRVVLSHALKGELDIHDFLNRVLPEWNSVRADVFGGARVRRE